MAKYTVGFDGRWQESFGDRDAAIGWAREVAETGRTVEVIRRRFGLPSFVAGFPEAAEERLAARWAGRSFLGMSGDGASGSPIGGDCGGGGGDGGGGGC